MFFNITGHTFRQLVPNFEGRSSGVLAYFWGAWQLKCELL